MYIRYKLGLSFGGMIVLIMAIVLLSRYDMRIMVELDRRHDQLQNMQLIFTEVRRHEKNYLMRSEGGWAEQTLSNVDRLRHMLQDAQSFVVPDEQVFRSNALGLLQEYRKEFTRLIKDRTSAEEKRTGSTFRKNNKSINRLIGGSKILMA